MIIPARKHGHSRLTNSPSCCPLLRTARTLYVARANFFRGFLLAGQPVPEPEHKADQSTHDSTVKPDELQVSTDPLLNLGDQRAGLQGFQIFSHGEANLVVVS